MNTEEFQKHIRELEEEFYLPYYEKYLEFSEDDMALSDLRWCKFDAEGHHFKKLGFDEFIYKISHNDIFRKKWGTTL